MKSPWEPAAALDRLRERQGMLGAVRDWFYARGVLEVETPLMGTAGTTDPMIRSFEVDGDRIGESGGRARWYLQTSPEFFMKRLLAAGSGDVFQICKAFRRDESGRLHNPEFTLLEWYRLGFSMEELVDEVEVLVRHLLPGLGVFRRHSYGEVFQSFLNVDPLSTGDAELKRVAAEAGIDILGELDRSAWLQLLFTHLIEPQLKDEPGIFIYGFPAAQASLARLDPGNPAVARRFELYVGGIELANGYEELVDGEEQARRFARDTEQRRRKGLESVTVDGRFLDALRAGLPACAGVALGIDRLLMLRCGAQHLDEVLAFPAAIS
ncbi:MAG: EF-P lysine aminoacylase EpmA [Pseudomonadota bacterium]